MSQIDHLEYCKECRDYFEKGEGTITASGDFICDACAEKCIECGAYISEETSFKESFCSKDCHNLYFHDLYEDDWKENN